MATLNEKLMCQVLEVQVNIERHTAFIRTADGQCVDMVGAIDLVTSMDPDAAFISTFSGGRPDTKYRKNGDEWKAYPATLTGAQDAVRQ